MRVRTLAAWGMCWIGCSSSGSGGPADAMTPTGTTPSTTAATTSTTGNGGGGAGGSGTGAGGAGGVTPRAQASVSLYLTTFANAMAGMACPTTPHWVNVPFVAAGGQQTFTNVKGTSAVDGENELSVSCTVKGAGGVFDVSASLHSPASDPATGSPVNPTLVTLSTSIAEGSTSNGTVTVQDSRTATAYTSVDDSGSPAHTCTFSVKPISMNDQLGIAPGRIWATVSCPRFRDAQSSNANEICSIASGVIVLENCQQ